MTNKTFNISGRVIGQATQQGVAGLRVEAWDKDLILNDLLGSDATKADGTFQMSFDESYFRELCLDRQPDLYFKIYNQEELIKSTEDSVLWNVKEQEHEVLIELETVLSSSGTYTVTVDLDDATLTALKKGFQMQVYKGVMADNPEGALPTVWFSVKEFSSTVKVQWTETYGGYFSNSKVEQGVTVDISSHKSMVAGNVITLKEDGSTSVSSQGGVKGAFSFVSKKDSTWASGLMVAPIGRTLAPVCAFPQYGAVGNVIEPYQKVLILFTQKQLDTGAVVETAVSKSVSIILSPSEPEISVSFNINKGWDTNGDTRAVQNPQDFAMAPDLIIPNPKLAAKMTSVQINDGYTTNIDLGNSSAMTITANGGKAEVNIEYQLPSGQYSSAIKGSAGYGNPFNVNNQQIKIVQKSDLESEHIRVGVKNANIVVSY